MIGAAEYRIGENEARTLERTIRRTCIDASGRPLDSNARACLQLADVLAEDLEAGASPERIELGMSHVEGLCEYVVHEDGAAAVK